MLSRDDLISRVVAYDPQVNQDLLGRAYDFALEAHKKQIRASGEPYFHHPLSVAEILISMRLDQASIITALLHDTVEDTTADLEQVTAQFGEEVGKLVDGVTKLGKIALQSQQQAQAENFRKLVLATSEDIRVLLVKLADRLHNMRTLHYIDKEEKRRRIALETMEIYAPLAERIGLYHIKDELQDMAFKEINPDARASILARLEFLRTEGESHVDEIIAELQQLFLKAGIKNVKIAGREKAPYSIWRKMEQKNIGFEQLADIMAFRVVVDDVASCYQVLGLIHSAYSMIPDRFKDYISTPKPNGYQSIHTVVIGPANQRIEIQIRTQEMHDVAELGIAAHWAYKQREEGGVKQGKEYRWLRELLDILEYADPQEFLEHTKLEMYTDQVFCFSPKGDLIALPLGASIVDFAYAVHSKVGDTCVGARVNGRIMPLKTKLTNGDQVEILCSKAQTPSPAWEKFVVTAKAKAHIRRFLRVQRREQYLDLGRSMLQKAFRQEGLTYNEKAFETVLRPLGMDTVENLLTSVGEGTRSMREVLTTLFPELKGKDSKRSDEKATAKVKTKTGGDHAIPIRGLIPGMAIHYAKCCHPLPGDKIVGLVTTGKGVTIHTSDCEALHRFEDQPERWLDVSWDVEEGDGGKQNFIGRIHIIMENEPGGLGTLGTMIAKNEGNIYNLRIVNRTIDYYELYVDVEVEDASHLNNLISSLRASSAISSVERTKNK